MTTSPYELLDRIFATTQCCLVHLDRNLAFVRVNKAYADICGHPRQFFVGKKHFDLYPSEKFEAVFRRAVATAQPFTIYANPFVFPDRPASDVTYWDWTLHPLTGDDGSVEGLLFALLDVTERKRAEDALRASEHMHRLVLDHVDEVVYLVSMANGDPLAGTVDFVSGRVKVMLGHEPEDFLTDPTLWL